MKVKESSLVLPGMVGRGLLDQTHIMKGLWTHRPLPAGVAAALAGLAPAAGKPPPVRARTKYRWDRTPAENTEVAVHEAGHACAADRVRCAVVWVGLDPEDVPHASGACKYDEPKGGLRRADTLFLAAAGPAAALAVGCRRRPFSKDELDAQYRGDRNASCEDLGPVSDAEWGQATYHAGRWVDRNWRTIRAVADAILAAPKGCLAGEELKRLLAWHYLT
jgi:hypothetical protein